MSYKSINKVLLHLKSKHPYQQEVHTNVEEVQNVINEVGSSNNENDNEYLQPMYSLGSSGDRETQATVGYTVLSVLNNNRNYQGLNVNQQEENNHRSSNHEDEIINGEDDDGYVEPLDSIESTELSHVAAGYTTISELGDNRNNRRLTFNEQLENNYELFNRGHQRNVKNMGKTKQCKNVVFSILSMIILGLVILSCWKSFQLKKELQMLKRNGTKRNLFVKPENETLQATVIKKRKIAAINLCGKNDQLEMSKKGVAFYDWKKTLQKGDISYAHNYIIINLPGIYYVYAQMFFFVGKGTFKHRFLHFYISKNRRERLAVSLNAASCPSSCTRSVAHIVHLNRADHLSVTFLYAKNIPFKVSPDKSNFGAYLLKAD